MAKHVILGKEHEHHPKDGWQIFELDLVVILVACHGIAFVFFAWLLYRTRRGVPGTRTGGKWAPGSAGSSREPSRKGTTGFEWRTPREILAAQQKARLGKV
ncbi:hypothetical protein CHLRE_01g013200v5 [Chlamydomonas reinhardtii]|uniref:Uncharacterized protein n=1 Tax=Chlamydomonas reinhardtii TaxID=3055 RepID=A0A2K3E5R5_CHLRE|nr:uncharacterized protein CHLRE_01g013200v5 [Chlamydomonas reinhardtii]PNW88077.1 hypothetical protein CHLRE_01g013200v5 [Chlamydomonas reinhardtii]